MTQRYVLILVIHQFNTKLKLIFVYTIYKKLIKKMYVK